MPQPGKLVVRGYGPETTDDEIRTWFEPFGPLEEVASPPDPVTKQSRGFTFVRFVNPADAERALKEMQKDVNKMKNGFTIRVEQSLYARGMGPTAQLRVAMSERRNDDDRGRYDRTERYAYGSRRPRSRSPPYRRGYDDYYPRDRYGDDYGHRYYEDYYRERYPVPPPRRDYYDRYEDRYTAPPRRDEYTAGTTPPETATMSILRITTADMIVGGGLHLILVIAASPMQVFRARDVETAMPKIVTTARVLPGGWSAVVLTQWSGIPRPVSR